MSRTIKVVSYTGHNRSWLLISRRNIHVDVVLLVCLERDAFKKVIKYFRGCLAHGHFTREMTITRSWDFFIMGLLILRMLGIMLESVGPIKHEVKEIKTSILDPLSGPKVR